MVTLEISRDEADRRWPGAMGQLEPDWTPRMHGDELYATRIDGKVMETARWTGSRWETRKYRVG